MLKPGRIGGNVEGSKIWGPPAIKRMISKGKKKKLLLIKENK